MTTTWALTEEVATGGGTTRSPMVLEEWCSCYEPDDFYRCFTNVPAPDIDHIRSYGKVWGQFMLGQIGLGRRQDGLDWAVLTR